MITFKMFAPIAMLTASVIAHANSESCIPDLTTLGIRIDHVVAKKMQSFKPGESLQVSFRFTAENAVKGQHKVFEVLTQLGIKPEQLEEGVFRLDKTTPVVRLTLNSVGDVRLLQTLIARTNTADPAQYFAEVGVSGDFETYKALAAEKNP